MDSVDHLKHRIAFLQKEVQDAWRAHDQVEARLTELQISYAELSNEYETLKHLRADDRAKLRKAEEERDTLRDENRRLRQER